MGMTGDEDVKAISAGERAEVLLGQSVPMEEHGFEPIDPDQDIGGLNWDLQHLLIDVRIAIPSTDENRHGAAIHGGRQGRRLISIGLGFLGP